MLVSPPAGRGSVTRARLITAALDLFASRGYHATTTALLAERTGIAEGTIYRHFPGKDALYSAVCQGVYETLDRLIQSSVGLELPARERAAEAARQLISEAQKSPAAVRLQGRPPELAVLDDAAREAHTRFRDRVNQLIAIGKQEGVVRSGAADLWGSLWLAVIGSVCERVAAQEFAPEHPNVGLAIDAAWDLVKAPPVEPPAA
jgi:AcrR family transcriptional regulator